MSNRVKLRRRGQGKVKAMYVIFHRTCQHAVASHRSPGAFQVWCKERGKDPAEYGWRRATQQDVKNLELGRGCATCQTR